MTTDTQAGIAAVHMMMERFGLTVTDLTRDTSSEASCPAPTFAEFIPATIDRMPAGRTRENYRTYWNKILAQPGWPERRLDDPTPADLQVLCEQIRAARVVRHSDRGDNPATRLTKPKRTRSNRRALPTELLTQVVEVAATTGNAPELDSLILRLPTETACRRAGALALRPQDLDPVQSVILLREKGGTQLWQPVSPTLMQALCRHAERRGAHPERTTPARPQRQPHLPPPLQPPLRPPGHTPALGRQPRHLDPLAPPHHHHLGRTPLRHRHRSRIRPPQPHRHRTHCLAEIRCGPDIFIAAPCDSIHWQFFVVLGIEADFTPRRSPS